MGKGSWLARLGLARPSPISLAEFRDRVVAEVRRRRPEVDLRLVGDAKLRLGDDESTYDLTRGYAYYGEHPRDLALAVSQCADLILHQPQPAKPEDLIILVRPDTFRATGEGSEDRGPYRPIVPGLIAIVAVDTPERYEFFKADALRKELGLDDGAIWDRAMSNLRQTLSSKPPQHRPGRVMTLTTGIGLASSLLVLEDFWRHPQFTSRGDWVVAPLERDELVLAPLDEPDTVRVLRNIVASRPETSGFLCDQLLLRRNGAWEPFE